MNINEHFMQRALFLAQLGTGYTAPNPMVGCVIVWNNIIIGEGWHKHYGEPHAEVNAINSVKDKQLLKHSTLYVTLEPCSHFGKTPPCADLIIKHGIPKVVVATLDPNPKVAGKGILKLQNNDIEVLVGCLENEARHINRRFFTFHQLHRPYVVLKWAQTLDNFIDCNNRGNKNRQDYWISNERLKYRVHQLRSNEAAIFCGANTLINDNPKMNVRLLKGKQPIRITFINKQIDTNLHFFDNSQPSWIFTTDSHLNCENIRYFYIDENNWHKNMLNILYENSVNSILIEGGKNTLDTFISNNLWDEAFVLIGNTSFGKGLPAPKIDIAPQKIEHIDDNLLIYYRNNE